MKALFLVGGVNLLLESSCLGMPRETGHVVPISSETSPPCSLEGTVVGNPHLTWPMAKLFFGGITYLVGKIKFKLSFQGPLSK